jgi:anti-sigma factor RsiW
MAANPTKQSDDIELMQHADGELDERASVEVRARIERDTNARTKVESLGQMSELVRGHLELSADSVADRKFEAMWRTINREIGSDAPKRAGTEAPREGRGVWGRIGSWFDRYRGHVITGAVSAGAVAALALILRPAATDNGGTTAGAPQPIEVQPAALRAAPVVEALDTPNGEGTVLNLEDEDGHTTVIWVTPADTVEGI